MNRNGLIGAGFGAVLLLLGVIYLASPYVAASSLQSAIRSGDRDMIAQRIDFPEVRDSLKSQFNAAMLKKIGSDPSMKDNPFAGFGAMLAPMLIDKMLDAYVTADSFASLAKPNTHEEDESSNSPFAGTAKSKYRASYVNLNRFDLIAKNGSKNAVGFELRRSGLWTWRVERIDLPFNALTNSTGDADKASSDQTSTATSPPDQPQQRSTNIDKNTTADVQTAKFSNDPPFDAYGAGPIFTGSPAYPDFGGHDQKMRMYRTMIRDGIAQGPKFAGSFALVQFGCGTDCTMGYVVDLRSGHVIDLPAGGEEDPDMQISVRSNSRLMVVMTQAGGMDQTTSQCIRRLFRFDDERFLPLPGEEVVSGTCPTLSG